MSHSTTWGEEGEAEEGSWRDEEDGKGNQGYVRKERGRYKTRGKVKLVLKL